MKIIFVYYQTIRCFSMLALLIILGMPGYAQENKPGKAKADENLLVTGVLVDRTGKPVAGKSIYYFPVEDEYVEFAYEGTLKNPFGKSDTQGRFIIEVEPDMRAPRFTLGFPYGSFGFLNKAELIRGAERTIITFSVDSLTKKIDVGKITVD